MARGAWPDRAGQASPWPTAEPAVWLFRLALCHLLFSLRIWCLEAWRERPERSEETALWGLVEPLEELAPPA